MSLVVCTVYLVNFMDVVFSMRQGDLYAIACAGFLFCFDVVCYLETGDI